MTNSTTLHDAAAAAVVDHYLPLPYVVTKHTAEAPLTATLDLQAATGDGMAFQAGQFTMIGRPGHAEVPISISGDPADSTTLVHTVRAVGDASRALVNARVGDTVLVRGPYGRGWDVADAQGNDVLILAGGIGLAPLRPAILEVLAHRERYGRVIVVYGSRSPDQLLYPEQLEHWRGRFDVEVRVTVDAAEAGWRGPVGVVTTVLPPDLDPEHTMAFVCGPEIMMRLSADVLVDRGLPPGQVRVSMERNMKCGIGLCGHCQLRELFICTDGPVFGYQRVRDLLLGRGL
jgi:NAD(P)H-flavin reductase